MGTHLNHLSCVKPRSAGQKLGVSSSTIVRRPSDLSCMPLALRPRRRAVPSEVKACSRECPGGPSAGDGSSSPAAAVISYAKLLALTGAMAASVLFDKRPAHAATIQPEPVHTVVQSSSKPNKKGVWQRLKATATAPVEALDKVLFPDEPISFLRLAADKESEPASTAAHHSAPAAPEAPPAADKSTALPILDTLGPVEALPGAPTTPSSSPVPITDSSRSSRPAAQADDMSWRAVSSQLTSTVSAASDSLAARLAQLSSSLSPSWPAESAALGGVSSLPAQLAGAEDPKMSAALAKQLVRGGYALAGLVVAVMAWQLAASVSAATKRPQATRPPADDELAAHDDASTIAVPPVTDDASSTVHSAQPHPSTSGVEALQEALPPQEGQHGPSEPPAAQEQQQLLPVIELGPGDVLPLELLGKNVVGPFCLMRPSLGPASHGHFSAAVTAAAAATADALHAEGEAMRRVTSAPVAHEELDKPLHHMTAQEAAGKGQEVMQAALEAAAAAAEAAEDSTPAVLASAAEAEEQQQQESSPAVSVELTAVQPAGEEDEDEPLFRVALKVCADNDGGGAPGHATPTAAASAAADSMEGRLAAEVVREALVAESCAAAAAAAAERAQIATHLIEDAIAAHSGAQYHTAAHTEPTAAAAVSSSASTSTDATVGEASAVEAGSITFSWEDEVSCSLAAEVRAAEVAAALTTKHDTVVAQQDIPVSWQQPPAAAAAAGGVAVQGDDQPMEAAAGFIHATFTHGPQIPLSWQQPATGTEAEVDVEEAAVNMEQCSTDEAAAEVTAAEAAPAELLDIPVSWQQPAALDDVTRQQLVEEAKAAEAAAWEAEAARAAAAAAVARVAAAKAAVVAAEGLSDVVVEGGAGVAVPDEQDVQQLVDEAKAAEAAAEQAEAARAAAAAAVARVAAAKAAQAAHDSSDVTETPSLAAVTGQVDADTEQLIAEAKAAEAAALEAEAARVAAAAAVARVAAAKAVTQATPAVLQEADAGEVVVEAEAAEAEALEARTAAAAAVARVAASKAVLARAAAEAVAEAAAQECGSSGAPDAANHPAAPAALSGSGLTHATQAELIAEAIAAEAAAIAAEAAVGASEAAAAADLSAGQAAELVKGWVSGSTTGTAHTQGSTPAAAAASGQAQSLDTSAHSSSSSSPPPVTVSWVCDVNDPAALAQLTQLAAGLGHPAIGPIGSSSSSSSSVADDASAESAPGAQSSGVVEQAVDCFAFLDEFGVPNDEPASFTSAQPAAAAEETTATKQAPPKLAEVLDAASQQQMQAASQTALQQAQARVVSLYRARKQAENRGHGQPKKASPAARKPEAPTQAAAAAASAEQSSRGLSALQQRLACQLGVSDVALALALAAVEVGELSPKGGTSSTGTARSDKPPAATTGGKTTPAATSSAAQASKQPTGAIVLSSSSDDPYASVAQAIRSNASTASPVAPAAEPAKQGSTNAKVEPSTAKNNPVQLSAVSKNSRLGRVAAVLRASQEQQVVIQGGDAESDSFEVAVQRMVINTARAKSRGHANKPAALGGAADTKAGTAAPGISNKGPARTSSGSSRAAADTGTVEVKITYADKAADSFEIAVQRMVSRAAANKAARSSGSNTGSAAAPTPTGVVPAAKQVINEDGSSSSDENARAPAGSGVTKEEGVSIKVKQPDMAADSFDIAVQRMVATTAARSARDSSSSSKQDSNAQKKEAFSSAHTRQALGARPKGFGRIITPLFKPQQPQTKTRQAVVGRVPLYQRSPSPGRSLKSLPWWEQKAAARSAANGWEGFKAPSTPAAPTAATPAASAAAAPTSIPVEWMETPTGQKRAELRERAGAILKQQQHALAPATDAGEAAAVDSGKARNGPSSTNSGPQGSLPSGWGGQPAARGKAAASKPRSWSAVSAELTQELESEMSEAKSGLAEVRLSPALMEKELSAGYATPQIKINATQPAKPQSGRVVKVQNTEEDVQGSKGGQGVQASKPPVKGDA